MIPIRLDAAYHFEPFELGILHIDAVGKSQRAWLDELRVALGLDVNSARGAPPVRVASPSTPATHAPVRVAGPATGTLAAAAPMRAPILVPRLSPAPTHVVDASGAGQYRTIGEAIAAAQPGDRVQIRPGTYREFVRLDTSLDLIGEGPREHIIIEWQEDYDKCAISMETSRALLANLTIRRLGAWTISHRSYYDTKIESGPGSAIACGTGQLEVYGCDLSSTGGDGIAVSGDAELVLTFCRIANCKQSGVSVAGKQGRATLEDNDIVSNYGDGLLLARDTIAIARRNRITGNAGYGIAFDGRASGTFEDNDLRNNGKGAWHLSGVTSLFGFGKVSGITRARNQE